VRVPRLNIVYEDEDVLIVNKPAGLLTSTVPRERRPTLLKIVREHVAANDPRARVGLIHRLDRDASGLLVFSKNHQAYASLKSQLFHHTIDRIYLAVVRGKLNPPAGQIESRLVELPDGSVRTSRRPSHGERAITEYKVINTRGQFQLLRAKLLTGRKHQIRAHLSERGARIVGDRVYGSKDDSASRLMLAAAELAFDHPRSGKRMEFVVEMPVQMKMIFR